ncbi:MAG TPA: hypothetical protein VM901_01230 [Bdellovibrionota bacterium]|nr:hypothetical protein [Bdellovibrionota bacterium]
MKKNIETKMREAGLNPALPHLILSRRTGVVAVSKRMCILLDSFEGKLLGLGEKKLAALWPFANQEDAGMRLLARLVAEAPAKFDAQFALQHYALESVSLDGDLVAIVAKVQRTGDLLSDKSSRQELFRTFAHELRTTAMALDGYLGMLRDLGSTSAEEKMKSEVLTRIGEVSGRLMKNVNLLDSLRDQLSTSDDDAA